MREQCSIEGREELLEGLPQLSPEVKAALDLELTLEELTGAVNQMASGRAPGLGLSGDQRDVQCLQDTLSLYERASSARVNWAKSSALLLGHWRDQVVPCLPGGLQWEKEGLKMLGVILGTEDFKAKNWEGVKEKVCSLLSKCKWLLPQMSYRGRVLVANTLVASTLWHRLMALTPPRNLMEDIQREIVDFFWSGRHWVCGAALYLPLAEGGQGLICIQSKMASFRLRTVSRLLYDCGPSWLNFGKLLLRSVWRRRGGPRWDFLGPDYSRKGSWRYLYKLPMEKRKVDLQWRIVHGAIATNRYRAHLDPELGEGCIFCSEVETLEHLFVQCPRLSALFVLLKSWFQGLGEEFYFVLFIYSFGPKYSVKKKGVHTLLNFLSGAAKMAIWLTLRSRVQGVGSVALQEPSAGCGERGATGAQCRVWGAGRYRSPVQGVGSGALQEPSAGCGERGATGAECRVWGAGRYRSPVQGVGSGALQEPSAGCGERGATGAQCRVWGAGRYRSPVQGVGSGALEEPSAGCGERGATGAQCRVWGAGRYRSPVQGVGSGALQEPSAGCGERGATGAQCRVWGAGRYRSPVQGVGSGALQEPSAGCGERGATGAQCRVWGAGRYRGPVQGVGRGALLPALRGLLGGMVS
ncbi:hypothetical protein NHX12_013042 [Muraenolepis orangiensis]|uniref:Reverse transcriptase zinc-binding domain-containing protein n=1 Tax=Muraenolepis orangiensis TaxID=630683 RepID=A0A9Q0I7P0_9TELE|nr:hypothetical protein NHX12_013042 [Muraenolepis orangiensis]